MNLGPTVIPMDTNNIPLTTISRSVDKKNRDHLVTKVVQSLEEPGGFRMDVTVWFRHKNEAMFYVDSVGNVHGPMDQHHTSRLGAMEQSATYLPGTNIQKETETVTKLNTIHTDQNLKQSQFQSQQHHSHHRHDSMSAIEHSDRELERLLNELQYGSNTTTRYHQQQHQQTQNTNHNSLHQHLTNESHFSESGKHPYRSPSANTIGARYTTRLTRDNSQTVTPVTLKVVETSQDNVIRDTQQDSISSRERLLLDELLLARQELDHLKRSRSLMGSEFYVNRDTTEQSKSGWEAVSKKTEIAVQPAATEFYQSSNFTTNQSNTGTRQRFFSTDMNKTEDDYRAASSLLPKRPQRTQSSSQMFESHSTSRRYQQHRPQHLNTGGYTYEERSGDNPPISTYSAHQEHLRQQKSSQQQQLLSQQHSSVEQRYTEFPSEVFEEVETITLQPIGKGVQDLEPSMPSSTMPRTPRATTPMSVKATGHSSGFATLPSNPQRSRSVIPQSHHSQQTHSHYQHQTMQHQRSAHQPYNSAFHKTTATLGRNTAPTGGNAFFDDSPMSVSHLPQQTSLTRRPVPIDRQTVDQRSQQQGFNANVTTSSMTTQNLSAVSNVTPISPQITQSRSGSTSSFIDGNANVSLKQVQDSAKYWYQPQVSREETINLLKTQPPGSFIVRDSTSFRDAFGLAVKVASLPPRVTLKSNDLQSELVRHYLIEPVANKGVRLKGFAQEPIFPTLAAFIHHHVMHAVALPIKLILPALLVDENAQGTVTDVNGSRNEWAYVGLDTLGQGLDEQKMTAVSPNYQNVIQTESQYQQQYQQQQQQQHHQQQQQQQQHHQQQQQQQQHQQQQVVHETTTTMHQTGYSRSEQRGNTLSPQVMQQLPKEYNEIQPMSGTVQNVNVSSTEQHGPILSDISTNVSRIGVTTGASVYETLYLGNYDVACGDGQKAIRTAVDHVLKQIHASGRHTECQLEVSPIQGLTLSDNRRKLFVRRNFAKSLIVICGLDPKSRSYDLQMEGTRTSFSGKIFAFVARKPNSSSGDSEGVCYVLCEASPNQTAANIVKDILKSLKTEDVNSS